MSEVISFRLNRDNLREAQALEILETWCLKGYGLRYVITEALLKLNDPGPDSVHDNPIPELSAVLNQVNQLLEQIGNGRYPLYPRQDENIPQSGLAESFVLSIKKAAKPGIKIE
jgi:DNA-directed RNA polymerase beta subunit